MHNLDLHNILLLLTMAVTTSKLPCWLYGSQHCLWLSYSCSSPEFPSACTKSLLALQVQKCQLSSNLVMFSMVVFEEWLWCCGVSWECDTSVVTNAFQL